MQDQPREQSGEPVSESNVPYHVRMGHTIVCKRGDCMHYGNHPNCVLSPMERDGDCFHPKKSPLDSIQ